MSRNDEFTAFEGVNEIFEGKPKKISDLRRNRRIWVMRDLLDNPLRQKDILELWRRRGRIAYEQYKKGINAGMRLRVNTPDGWRYATIEDMEIWKPKQFRDGIGISKGELSKIINGEPQKGYTGLLEDEIIKKTFVEKEEGYCLVETIEALYMILNEFMNPDLPKSFTEDLTTDLIYSVYAKSLINIDLVNKIQFFNDEPLNKEETNFILTLIKISPSALLKVLKILHNSPDNPIEPNEDDEGKIILLPENEKRNLLMDFQFLAYNDLSNLFPYDEKMTFAPPYPVNVQFEIKTVLKTKEGEYHHTSTFQRSSFELLSETEQEEAMKENKEIMEMLSSMPTITNKIPDLFEEDVDKRFSLESSPLIYGEKKN